jgi:hypothetical protein
VDDLIRSLIWFHWPVTFAAVAAIALFRLGRLGGRNGTPVRTTVARGALVVVSVSMVVVPLVIALPVHCDDDSHVLDLRVAGLGIGLFAIVAWLFVLFRLFLAAGDTRADADRSIQRLSAVLLVGLPVEFAASGVTLEVACGGTDKPLVAHLTAATLVLALGVVAAALGRIAATRRSP